MNDYIDLTEYHKNSIATDYQTFSSHLFSYKAGKKYIVGELPACIVVTTIYYFPVNNMVDNGTAANPATLRLRYIQSDGSLRELSRLYYHNRLTLVMDCGNTDWEGIVTVAYMNIKANLGYYR